MRDAARQAEMLMVALGSAASVVASDAPRLRAHGADDGAVSAIRWFADAMCDVLRERLLSGPVLCGSRELLDYLSAVMGSLVFEEVRALYLSASNHLIADEVVSLGSVAEAGLHQRRILARALELGAAALILAHNHPGGRAEPSVEDLAATRALAGLCGRLDIELLDHVVVSPFGRFSMRSLGALG